MDKGFKRFRQRGGEDKFRLVIQQHHPAAAVTEPGEDLGVGEVFEKFGAHLVAGIVEKGGIGFLRRGHDAVDVGLEFVLVVKVQGAGPWIPESET